MRDYHDFTTVDTPADERRRLNVGDIWINAASCHNCEYTARSTNRHDYHACKCGDVAVDGGSWYVRRSYRPGAVYTNHVEMFADAKETEL